MFTLILSAVVSRAEEVYPGSFYTLGTHESRYSQDTCRYGQGNLWQVTPTSIDGKPAGDIHYVYLSIKHSGRYSWGVITWVLVNKGTSEFKYSQDTCGYRKGFGAQQI